MKASKKVETIPFSKIREIFNRVNELKQEGKDIISLGIGEPDFDTPKNIVDAMVEAVKSGQTHYTPNKGILPLRQAIADKYQNEHGLSYDLEEIIVTVGVAEGVYVALSAYLDPGDEVLIPDPSWLNYTHVPTLNGAKAVGYPLLEANGFEPTREDLEALVTENTKALVVLNPSNPTGTAFSQETVAMLADFAIKHDLLVISDEIYEKIVYDAEHYCIAALEGMKERTILLNGMSKCYAMTGWRLGYMIAPMHLISPLAKMHAYLVTNATSMVQWAGHEALTGPQDSVEAMLEEFKRRRDFLTERVNQMPGLSAITPSGAFYLFVNVSGTGMTGEEFTIFALEQAGVAVVPGTAFGNVPVDYVRLSFATSMEQLAEACDRMERALTETAGQ